uniref:DUF3395 domain-containing protein n=1 Tax=Brugia timori TaxID=42155 RepID=A0A0R3QY78_9BILA
LLKRKRYAGREAVIMHSNQSKLCEFKQCINDDADIKEYQNALSNDNKQRLESSAPNTLILVSIAFDLGRGLIDFTFFDKKNAAGFHMPFLNLS